MYGWGSRLYRPRKYFSEYRSAPIDLQQTLIKWDLKGVAEAARDLSNNESLDAQIRNAAVLAKKELADWLSLVNSLYGDRDARGSVSRTSNSARVGMPRCDIICLMYLTIWKSANGFLSCGQHLKGKSVLRKRSKYRHYQFEHNGASYWGSMRETVKSKAEMFEALKRAEVAQQRGNVMLHKAPLLREFKKQFLEYNKKRMLAGSLGCRHGAILPERLAIAGTNGRGSHANGSNRGIGCRSTGVSRQSVECKSGYPTLRRMLSYAAEVGKLRAVPRSKLREEHTREGIFTREMETLLVRNASVSVRRACDHVGLRHASRRGDADVLGAHLLGPELHLVPFEKSSLSKRYFGPIQPHAVASESSSGR